MAFQVNARGRSLTVVLSDSVDLSESAAIKEAVEAQMNSDIKDLSVDGSGLTYIDSSGVASLLYMRKLASRYGAAFGFSGMSPACRRVIELAKLQAILGLVTVPTQGQANAANRQALNQAGLPLSASSDGFRSPASQSLSMEFKEGEALAALEPLPSQTESALEPVKGQEQPSDSKNSNHTEAAAAPTSLGVKPGSFS